MEDGSPPRWLTAARGCGGGSPDDTLRKARTKGGGGGRVRCTGRQCRSCTGRVVADCVAVCCCPCAVLNCLALVFVKLPYLIGKRWWLGYRRKRKKKKKKKGRKPVNSDGDAAAKKHSEGGGGDADTWLEKGFEEQANGGRTSEKFDGGENEKVWVELWEFDHLSFGRVSFAGIPLPGATPG